MKKIFYYFVSYVASTSYSFYVACTEFQTSKEITSFDDIQEIIELLQEKQEYEDAKVIILNYQLLRVEEENDDDE